MKLDTHALHHLLDLRGSRAVFQHYMCHPDRTICSFIIQYQTGKQTLLVRDLWRYLLTLRFRRISAVADTKVRIINNEVLPGRGAPCRPHHCVTFSP